MPNRDADAGADRDASREDVEREFLQRIQEEMLRLSVAEHLSGVLRSLPSMAFQRLGLTEESREQRDLEQARLAVDAFRALLDVLAPTLPADDLGMYRSTLAQMQMAYVGAIDSEKSESSGDAEAAAASEAEGPDTPGDEGDTDTATADAGETPPAPGDAAEDNTEQEEGA